MTSRKTQLADRALYRFVGIEPTEQAILVAAAPGPMIADPSEFAWTRLASGVRLRPLGPLFRMH